MPTQTPISPLDITVVVGDSITALLWYQPAVDDINASFTPRVSSGAVVVGAAASKTVGGVSKTTPKSFTPRLQVVNSGQPGDGVDIIEANVATRILAHNPTIVVLQVGVNDCLGDTPSVDFTTKYNSILSQVKAAIPSIKLMCIPILTIGEQWKTVLGVPQWNDKLIPPPSNPTFTPWIDDYNAIISSAAATAGANLVETRNEYLAYEVANNTPEIGEFKGVLTLGSPSIPEGVHPNPAGQVFLSGIFQTHLAVSQPP